MPTTIPLKSQNVCQPCRARKQKCDKSLPTCSRCASRLVKCCYDWNGPESMYPESQSASPPSRLSSLICEVDGCYTLSERGAQEIVQAASFTAKSDELFRLTCNLFNTASVSVAQLLEEYFCSIHHFLPILDDHIRDLNANQVATGPDDALVLLALFLVTRWPCQNNLHTIDDTLYKAIKQAFMLQASALATLQTLRAGLLIAYFACGHGFPRDAHLIISTSVTIARMMDLEFDTLDHLTQADSQGSQCLWALVLLDRALLLSSLVDPVPSALPLPLDSLTTSKILSGALGASGVVGTRHSCHQHNNFEISSRVALLVGAALTFANKRARNPLSTSLEAYRSFSNQMEDLMTTLIRATEDGADGYTYCESTALSVITYLALQSPSPMMQNGVPDTEDPRKQLFLHSAVRMVREQSKSVTSMLSRDGDGFMPVVALCSLARAAVIALQMCGPDMPAAEVQELRENLRRYGKRWAVGNIYLNYINQMMQGGGW